MDARTSLLIALFQFVNLAMADWDPNNPLILVKPTHYVGTFKTFPLVVRSVNFEGNRCEVYYNQVEENVVTTYEYCPKPDVRYSEYCNHIEYFYNKRDRVTKRCEHPVDYEMIPRTDSEGVHEPCSQGVRRGFRYRFVYWLCENNNERRPIQIYEVCFQENAMQMIFGKYTIDTPNLLGNPLLTSEQSYPFEFDASHHYDLYTSRVSRALHELYNQNGEYLATPVLPHEWIPFAPQRKSLFNYMNSGPMSRFLKPAWETLMKNLKYKLSLIGDPINVTAGVLGQIQEEEQSNQYLGIFEYMFECPLPKYFWVLIYNRRNTEGVVIMMDNEPVYPNDESYFKLDCNLQVCSDANLLNAIPERQTYPMNANIYCCKPNVITSIFNLRGGSSILRFPDPSV